MGVVVHRGERKGLLSARYGHGLCADLRAVHDEMHDFLHVADRGVRVGHGFPGRECTRRIERTVDCQDNGGDGKVDGLCVLIDVGDTDTHLVRACRKERTHVYGNSALRHVLYSLDNAADPHGHYAVACGDFIFERRPVETQHAGSTEAYGLGQPSRGVRHGKHGVVSTAATASATAGDYDAVTDALAIAVEEVEHTCFGVELKVCPEFEHIARCR